MNEYECICGHIWIDDANYGCPMCGDRYNVVRRRYKIQQPQTFAKRKKEVKTRG